MVNIVLAFVTGLTTGGLSCLAVQGGLVASSLAQQIEQSPVLQQGKSKKAKNTQAKPVLKGNQIALPILAFLAAKLLAYTVLGFLLGMVGSVFQLSPIARAVLQIGIGIFMLGSAMRLLNVHPIFRYFVIEPPAFIRRYIRRTSKAAPDGGPSLVTPVFLGFLTVLIPCGITQAMMAVALSTANPLEGAAMMFAFTLGASPVFFIVAYFATQLGTKLEKHFTRFVAVVLVVLGIFAIDTGLTLGGSPVSLTRMFTTVSKEMSAKPVQASETNADNSDMMVLDPATGGTSAGGGELQVFDPQASAPESPTATTAAEPVADDGTVVTVTVKNTGYDPDVVYAKAGVPVKLRLVSENVYSCSLAFMIPSLGVQMSLEPTGEAVVEIPPQAKGTKMPFSCSMGMFVGDIVFE